MTVATTTITAGPYAGNGLAVEFAFGFRVDDEAELLVFETDDTGAVTTLELGTDYTVAGVGNDEGGTVTRVAGALPSGYSWYIRRSTPRTQPTDFNSQGGFFPDVHEAALDRLTYMVQELEDRIERAARFADSYSGTVSLTLPEPESAAFLRWNEAGDALMNDPSIGAVEGALGEIAAVAGIVPEVEGVYAIRSDVTTVAGIAANVIAVAGISAEIQTCAANITAIQNAPAAATVAQNAKMDAESARDLAEQYRDEAQAAGYDSTNVAITGGTINGTNINYATVGKAEAEAGTATTVRNWTALRVKQAIDALAPLAPLVNIQEFSTSGTWTKPPGAQFVLVEQWGPGGGGRGGMGAVNGATGTANGGAGGGGGRYVRKLFRADQLPSNVSVVIGAGGAGGAGGTVTSSGNTQTPGQSGGDGGSTLFGSYVVAYGGGGAAGSVGGGKAGDLSGAVLDVNGTPDPGDDIYRSARGGPSANGTSPGGPGEVSILGGPGGGGGGNTTGTAAGGDGGSQDATASHGGGGAGGVSAGQAGANGSPFCGGGGGASRVRNDANTVGGAGGAGGVSAGGGGGGGALAQNTTTTRTATGGDGGKGGDGYARITTW